MRLLLLTAALFCASLGAAAPAAAQAMGQTCVLHWDAADARAGATVRAFLERRPGHAVTTCTGDRDVSHQAMSPARIEAGVCRMSVQRFTDAGLAAAAADTAGQAAAFQFMAEPDAGECPARGKGRWVAVTAVEAEDFARISRLAAELTRGGRAANRDGGCRKREDKLRRLVQGHALISVRREADGLYAIQLLRSGMGYAVSVALTPDGACVRGYGQFIV